MKLDKIFLYISILILIVTVAWVFQPSNKVKYHLMLTGMGRGRVHPFKEKFKPYSGKTMGGAAALATAVNRTLKSFNEDAYNFISIGTELSGTADAYFTKGKTVVDIMNQLGLQAMLLSNIDFSYGAEQLKALKKDMKFEFLSSNIVERGKDKAPDWLQSELILEPTSGLKVGFLGISPVKIPTLVAKENIQGLNFLEPAQVLKHKAQEMRKQGVGLLVLLTQYSREHISYEEWQGILEIGPDICILLDQDLEAPKPVIKDGVLIYTLSSFNQTKELDILSLELQLNPVKIIGLDSNRVAVTQVDYEPEPEMLKVIDASTKEFRALRETHLANFDKDYSRSYNFECAIGNFVTDSLVQATGAQIALHNSGGIQYNIASGSFTLGDLYSLLPFDNKIFVVELKGIDLLEILKIAASRQRGVLQTSGLLYSFVHKNPREFTLMNATLVTGEPIEEDALYKVAVNSFLYEGGDNFEPFKKGVIIEEFNSLREIVKDHMLGFGDEVIILSYQDRIRVEE